MAHWAAVLAAYSGNQRSLRWCDCRHLAPCLATISTAFEALGLVSSYWSWFWWCARSGGETAWEEKPQCLYGALRRADKHSPPGTRRCLVRNATLALVLCLIWLTNEMIAPFLPLHILGWQQWAKLAMRRHLSTFAHFDVLRLEQSHTTGV